MAFNPLKNRTITVPTLVEDKVENIEQDQNLVTYNSEYNNTSTQESSNTDYSNSGLDVKSIVDNESFLIDDKSPKDVTSEPPAPAVENTLIEIELLESLPLAFILEKAKAIKNENSDNKYTILNQTISIKDNKWYNVDYKRGNVNAFSLAKHLLTLNFHSRNNNQNIPFFDNSLVPHTQKWLTTLYKEYELIIEAEKLKHNQTREQKEAVNSSTEIIYHKADKPKDLTKEEHLIRYKRITEDLNNISLDLIMEYIGANPNEDGERGKWKVWSTGDNIAVTGQRWFSWKGQEGGHGAISLLAFHLATENNISVDNESKKALWKMARNQLIENFGIGDLADLAGNGELLNFKVPFAMPLKLDTKINQVRNYLHDKRQIPLWIVNKQINSGFLFAGFPADWKDQPRNKDEQERLPSDKIWAIFLSSNSTAAEMRAIDRSDNFAKMLAKGSDKDYGGYAIKAEKDVTEHTIAALEASVDSMSYHAFYPGRISTSCMGTTYNLAVKAAMQGFSRNFSFQLAFDNDQAGNESTIRFREALIKALGEDALDRIEAEKDIRKDTEEVENPEELKERNDLIFKLGFEKYQELYADGKINYFDLSMLCLSENIKNNSIFYLDVQDNPIGLDVVRLFHTEANKKFGKNVIQDLITNKKIRYLNVCPLFDMMQDHKKSAQEVYDKLIQNKPYYLRIKVKDNENDNSDGSQNKRSVENRLIFEEEFKKIAGPKYDEWMNDGTIITKKIAIAKDWNEFFIYKLNNDLEFKEKIKAQEEHYAHYNTPVVESNKKNKP